MRNRFLRLALFVLAVVMLTGCESVPMPTGASMPKEDQVWGSADDSAEQAGEKGEEDGSDAEEGGSAE